MRDVEIPESAFNELCKMGERMQRMQNDINIYVSAVLRTLSVEVQDSDRVEIDYPNKKLNIKAKGE